jgi:hypothetical protein
MDALREDVAPTWLAEPLSLEETAERYVRPALRNVFVDLCQQPVSHYLDRFGFRSDLLRAMYAVTDGFSGLNGTWDTPGTGMNFLVHNMVSLSSRGHGTKRHRPLVADAFFSQPTQALQIGLGRHSITMSFVVLHGCTLACCCLHQGHTDAGRTSWCRSLTAYC